MIQRSSRHPSNIQNQYSWQFHCHPLKPLFERHQLDDSHTLGEMVEVGMDLNMEFRMEYHQLGSKNLEDYYIGYQIIFIFISSLTGATIEVLSWSAVFDNVITVLAISKWIARYLTVNSDLMAYWDSCWMICTHWMDSFAWVGTHCNTWEIINGQATNLNKYKLIAITAGTSVNKNLRWDGSKYCPGMQSSS